MFSAEKSCVHASHNHHQEQIKELYTDFVSPPFQPCDDEIKGMIGAESGLCEPEKKKKQNYLLPKYGSRYLKQNTESCSSTHGMQCFQSSSTEATIRVAAEKFIQSMSATGAGSGNNKLPMLNHPYPLPHSQEAQLIQNLLFCAEKVADNQYERALKFIRECDKETYSTGTPIQRLVFYFTRALFGKIANETGRIILKDREEKHADPLDLKLLISFHERHPLAQVTKLVGIQAILDHLECRCRKVHVIDLQIRSGVQWIILMQDLASRTENPIHHLKITAVATKWKPGIEEVGRQLASFAHSLNLRFTFKIVMVDGYLDLNQALFDLETDESIAVYAPYVLASFVNRVSELDHLMKTMKKVNPCVMIVTELEVNCNSPTFIGRFVESLFFFGAFFDSLEDCFEKDETSRGIAESSWFGRAIRNILADDGEERKCRHVNVSVWRAFFARFGLVEMELSGSSVDQACLGLQSLAHGRSCTLYGDAKCLIIGWKGTPLSSLSAWKFQ